MSSSSPSLFLSYFSRDTGAQSSLFDLFSLHELAPLANACKTCYSWLDRNGALERRYRDVTPTTVHQVRGWVRRHIGRLNIKLPHSDSAQVMSFATSAKRTEWILRLQREMQAILPELSAQFVQLRQLELHIGFKTISADLVHRSFETMPLLRILAIHTPPDGCDEILDVLFDRLGLLTSLATLSIHGLVNTPSRLNFTHCLGLKMLKQINLPAVGERYVATETQLSVLTRLLALAGLNFGRYTEHELQLLLSGKTGHVDGVVALVDVALNQTMMTPAIFDQLCALKSTLIGIWPFRWQSMSVSKFAQLESFASLTKLSICPDTNEDVQEITYEHHVHPALLACPRLSMLQLGSTLSISEAHLAELVTALPALSFLVFFCARLGGLAPLSQAAALTKFTLIGCFDLAGVYPSWRPLIPALPSCTELSIQDGWSVRLLEDDAKPLNEALMLRLPRLTPAKFTQNLKKVDPM